jgi:hypothetical protein
MSRLSRSKNIGGKYSKYIRFRPKKILLGDFRIFWAAEWGWVREYFARRLLATGGG